MDRLPSSSFPSTELRTWWQRFFDGDLKSVKAYGMHGEVADSPFRSVCWKIYFKILPDDDIRKWPESIAQSREEYLTLRNRHILDPSKLPGDMDLAKNNPLSLDDENPWKRYFDDAELQKTIHQDVDRTFPEQDFFRDPHVQRQLADILFVWSKENDDISYRQGMHELLALIYFVVAMDQIPVLSDAIDDQEKKIDDLMNLIASPSFIEHDSFAIFSKLMQVTKTWFESNQRSGEVEVNARGEKKLNLDEKSLFGKSGQDSDRQNSSEVIRKCNRVHHQLLKSSDPSLYNHLNKLGIEPQLYGLRWIRLIFGREFHVADVLKLWDAIFADDPQLGIVEHVCLAMLLYLRENLLSSDFTGCLSRLMKYPPVENVLWIFERALKIRDAPQNLKPIPINGPPPTMMPSPSMPTSVSSQPKKPGMSVFDKTKKLATKPSRPQFTGASAVRTTSSASADSHDTSELVERERKLQLELNHLHQMNQLLSEQLHKGILILHQELLNSDAEKQPDQEKVVLALAGLKQVKDILGGNLPFDPTLLHINDSAFNITSVSLATEETQAAEQEEEVAETPQSPEAADLEAQEERLRLQREQEEMRRQEELRKKEEERRAEEERRRRRLEQERKAEEERRKRREEEEERERQAEEERKARAKAKIPANIFDHNDDDDFIFGKEEKKASDKLSALLE